jgi:AraC-like DNA-binding protein
MTPDDRNSTSGATVLAAMVAGQIEAARAFGLPADALAAQAALPPEALADPDGRVPLDRFIALWEAIEAAPGSADFGFWLGRNTSVPNLGAVGYAMVHAPDVRAAFHCLTRFARVIGDVISPEIEERGEHVVFQRAEAARIARLSVLSAAAPVGTLTLLRELTGVDPGGLVVSASFQHPPPAAPERYRQALGCPVEFNAPAVSLVIQRRAFDLPLRRSDQHLFAYLERHVRALDARVAADTSIAARVRQHLIASVREGEPRQSAVARALALSERTLQRRLADEGTTFAALVDEVRLELARMYLGDPKLAVFEIAFLLGYSEPSAFNRAFRRWTGRSPREFREAAATL